MCFSATASFCAGGVLAGVGVLALSKTRHPHERFFAAIPLLFAVQQCCEGWLWLVSMGPERSALEVYPTYLFLLFAQVLWPMWIPYALLAVEADKRRHGILLGLCVMGTELSFYLGSCLLIYGARADNIGHHIHYTCPFPPAWSLVSSLVYGVATVVPALISSVSRMWVLGTAIAASYVMTAIYYDFYTISVWCYFAAVLSVIVVWILVVMHRTVPVWQAPPVAVR